MAVFADVGPGKPTATDPVSLAFDGFGDLWVTDYTVQKRVRFASNGSVTSLSPGRVTNDDAAGNGIAVGRDKEGREPMRGPFLPIDPIVIDHQRDLGMKECNAPIPASPPWPVSFCLGCFLPWCRVLWFGSKNLVAIGDSLCSLSRP